MCGIAGYSMCPTANVDRSLLTKLLLAGLAERGEDASGYASRGADGGIEIVKHALPPHRFLASVPVELPAGANNAIVHVRDHTKGGPSHHGNNHPIRHGRICGVHNGIIQNDDALFQHFGRERALPGASVDSEAIFMLFDLLPTYLHAFQHLIGSYSIAFFDERDPDAVHIVRGRGRPLVLAAGEGIAIAASTRHAIRFAARRLGLELTVQNVPTGSFITLREGRISGSQRFRVRPFDEGTKTTYERGRPNARLARRLADQQLVPPPLQRRVRAQ